MTSVVIQEGIGAVVKYKTSGVFPNSLDGDSTPVSQP